MSTISETAFRILLETVPDGFFVHDEFGHFLDVNAQSCADLGYSRDELLRLSINDISCGADVAANAARWRDAPAGLAMQLQETAVRKDGSMFPVEISLTCQLVDGRKLFFGLARDMTEREAARAVIEEANSELERRVAERAAELKQAHERMGMAVRVGGLGIWDYDLVDDRLVCDEQWYRIMGRDPDQTVENIASFRLFIHPADVERVTEVWQTAEQLVADGQDYGVEFRIVHPDGAIRWLRSTGHIVKDANGSPRRAVGFVVDVTDAQQATAKLEQQSREDPLTRLANRRQLDEELAKACLHATRTGEPLTLAMIDVDHFKLYNDSEGHVRGDDALKTVAEILLSVARRPYDLAARYGGEEFLLMLPGVDEAEPILDNVMAELAARRIAHPSSPVAPQLTISCGIVVAPELADVGPVELLEHCDRALYRAKAEGRNRVHVLRLGAGTAAAG